MSRFAIILLAVGMAVAGLVAGLYTPSIAARLNEVDYRAIYAPYGSITITPSDATVFSPICRVLYVGGTGNVTVRMLDGSTPTLSAVPVGSQFDMQIDQVRATGTTATLMVCLY